MGPIQLSEQHEEAGETERPRSPAGTDDQETRRRLAMLLGQLVAQAWTARQRDAPEDGGRSQCTEDMNRQD